MKSLCKVLIAFLVFFMFVACDDGGSSNPAKGNDSSEIDDDDSGDGKTTKKSSSSRGKSSSSSRAKSSSSSQKETSSLYDSCDADSDENCFLDTRDGHTYRTVKIGRQVWMAEDLKYDDSRFGRKTLCCGDTTENCEKLGRLYTWAAAIGETEESCGYGNYCGSSSRRGACPYGWHLPDTTEWNILHEEMSGPYYYSFSPRPTGFRTYNDPYDRYHRKGNDCSWRGGKGFFWSSTPFTKDNSYCVEMDSTDSNFELDEDGKYYAYSVRCVKDLD